MVNDAHQVIVATDLNNCAADSQTLVAMTEQTVANTGSAPKQFLADAGYCSQANLKATGDITEQTGTDFLIATGRLSHDESVPAAPSGRIPKGLTPKQRMARKLRTKPGRAAYARRRRSWNQSSARLPPCMANTSYSEGWTTRAVSGSCSRFATACANSTAMSVPPDWGASDRRSEAHQGGAEGFSSHQTDLQTPEPRRPTTCAPRTLSGH